IDRRVYGLNSEMQVQNLRFNRAYSLLVGVLIIVQILLAVLTIDWGNLDERFNSSFLKREDFVLKQNSTETDEHSKVPQSTTNASEFVVKP
ncbi:hypothetical protein AB6D79_15775, partial [Vibrio alginolyticus]